MDKEDLHILRLLGEIDRAGSPSQRELSRRLNLSLGLVNTFIKRLVKKGYFKVTTLPRNRVKYLLTPKGLTEKSKLTVEYLRYSVNFYRDIKNLLLDKYREMASGGVRTVLFLGSGEVAELAYLYLQLTGLRLAGVMDEERVGEDFFEFTIQGLEGVSRQDWDAVLLTRLDNTEQDIKVLNDRGVDPDRMAVL